MKLSTQNNSFSVGLFEVAVSTSLFAPITYFLFSYLFGQSFGLFASLLLPLSFLFILFRYSSDKKTIRELFTKGEIETAIFFIASFSFFLWACLQWPDFIAMGERLRDYALLSSVSNSPIVASEPWMIGENLNYYLFWYRFAAYWSSIFGISVWNTYHLLAAFSFSLFATTLFRLMRCYLTLSLRSSALLALLIVVGSNLAGVINAFADSSDWWGPSRVIKGTINEFPAWSFLLGDLHPHFLNLALTPFILCVALALINMSANWGLRLALVLFLFLLSGALQYNCNAWEVPMTGITFVIILIFTAFGFRKELFSDLKQLPGLFFQDIKKPVNFTILIALSLSLVSLILSCRNIQPADYPWHMVKSPIPVSTLVEILNHWGIPLVTILFALLLRIQSDSTTAISCGIILAIATSIQSSLLILVSLTLWIIVEAISDLKSESKTKEIIKPVLLYGLGVSSLVLIILGELIFLDDPYGGENERMNTIFKLYSATWAPLHIFAFCFMYRTLISKQLVRLAIPATICISAALPAFFIHTIDLRKNSSPSMEGLASVEQQFPGAADAIRFLRNHSRNTVLEAQGNPYSYTTHVATLGNQDSYLGWANHVGLLTGKHEEVGRREKITEQIYSSDTNCNSKKEIAIAEKIDLIVIGALEKQKYGSQIGINFSCFRKVMENSGYELLATKD